MRIAGPEDFPAFDTMLRSFLGEQETREGCRMLFTRRTLERYRELARGYLSGQRFGGVVLGEIETEAGHELAGFALCGEDDGPTAVDMTFGKIAILWMVWISPEHRKSGLGFAMLQYALPTLVEMHFDTVLMSVREGNAEGDALRRAMGALPMERCFSYAVKEGSHAPIQRE